jgi:predicted nuclease of predicted toxin-antitoxin system
MRIYLDDDCASRLLIGQLRGAGHDFQAPADVGLSGQDDAVHFRQAVREQRVVMTRNYRDFKNLHDLVIDAQGHHPGILVIRKDNDPKRDLKVSGIVRAIANLLAAGIGLADQYVTLNHWR